MRHTPQPLSRASSSHPWQQAQCQGSWEPALPNLTGRRNNFAQGEKQLHEVIQVQPDLIKALQVRKAEEEAFLRTSLCVLEQLNHFQHSGAFPALLRDCQGGGCAGEIFQRHLDVLPGQQRKEELIPGQCQRGRVPQRPLRWQGRAAEEGWSPAGHLCG